MKKILCVTMSLILILVMVPMVTGGVFAVTDPTTDYLCFTAEEVNSSVKLVKQGNPDQIFLKYSTDKSNWCEYTIGDAINLANIGNKVYFRASDTNANGLSKSEYNYYYFNMTGQIAASGNIMSLLGSNCQSTKIPCDYCFYCLFYKCSALTSAPELPATTLEKYCYNGMFWDCQSLISAPELPAMTLAEGCYKNMFNNCTSLSSAPETLPATTLANNCYDNMFYNCESLINAPALPATTLTDHCYYWMFYRCSSLTNAPALPATTLASNCYDQMFNLCTSLINAPALPATTLASQCYNYMFSGCKSLTAAPELPATTLTDYCYNGMFNNCSSLKNAPKILPATTLTDHCYDRMFYSCTSLERAPELPATTLDTGCYNMMFYNCSSLKNAPKTLPATTLSYSCYMQMFDECTSLTSVPELPAMMLANDCYHSMFANCDSLIAVKLPATTLADGCYTTMFSGCKKLKMVYIAATDTNGNNSGSMFNETSKVEVIVPTDNQYGFQGNAKKVTPMDTTKQSTVRFFVDEDEYCSVTNVEFFTCIDEPANKPEKSGYKFLNWSVDNDQNSIFEFDLPIVTDTNIYAMFEHVHAYNEYTISPDATSLTVSCTNINRDTPCELLTVTLKASDTEYTGSAYNKATLANYEQFHNETKATATDITYYLEGGALTNEANSGAAVDGGAPVKFGKYIAKVVINAIERIFNLEKSFSITADWTYSTTTDFTLKASYRNLETTVSLNAPDTEYTGVVYNKAVLTDYEQFHNDTEATKNDITYYLEGGATPTNASNSNAVSDYGAPAKVGRYVAKVTINTSKGSFILEKPFEIKEKQSTNGGYIYITAADNTKETDEKIKEIEEKTTFKESIATAGISMQSKQTKLNGKTAIKITWNIENSDLKLADLDNYEIFRSTKKNSGYGKKPYFTSSKPDYGYYINNKGLKKGKTYYYKVRGFKVIDGEKYYTPWSTKCWRTVK